MKIKDLRLTDYRIAGSLDCRITELLDLRKSKHPGIQKSKYLIIRTSESPMSCVLILATCVLLLRK